MQMMQDLPAIISMEDQKMKKKNVFYGNLALLIFIISFIFLCQYLLCIPINIHSGLFFMELFVLLFVLIMYFGVLKRVKDINLIKYSDVKAVIVLIVCVFLGFIIGTPYTGGLSSYRNQSVINETDFTGIPAFDTTQVQLVDKNTAIQLGDRVFGTLGSDEVSQYAVGEDWNQISYNGSLYRVTPIEFGGLFKYLITKTTPGYIMVDCESGDAKLVQTDGLKYTKQAYLNSKINRHVFLHDPFSILGEAKFELDDSQKPYWVVPVIERTFISKTRDVKGVYIVDPSSGDINYYAKDEAPGWVDNIYPISVVYDQFRQSKRYENGLFNWSKKGVVEFTDDYAYVQFDDHVYFYTGVTSVGKDESNVGFAYVNLRNGEISYIRRAGAEEYSARSSAEGAVQQYHYTAIFPSMVNINDVPTYFMGLVDGANLIKKYAFVSYENYQTVATGDTVDEAYSNYLRLLGSDSQTVADDFETRTIAIKDCQTIVSDGNSIVLLLDADNNIYRYELSKGNYAATFINPGDIVQIKVNSQGIIDEIIEISAAQQ